MEPCTTYQNTHHQSTVVIGSQRGKTCWPFMFMLMSNINYRLSYGKAMEFTKYKRMPGQCLLLIISTVSACTCMLTSNHLYNIWAEEVGRD